MENNVIALMVREQRPFTPRFFFYWGGGGGGGGGGRHLLYKGIQFSQSVCDRAIFHCTNSGKGLKYTCLERGPCLSTEADLIGSPSSPKSTCVCM